ncbi:MAG TPA: metallophosphoesterase [Bacillus bacterium]|uniref:Phosphoesterase n=1 Tax=Siminovitchia fordii TaxID=254759 RepID=A0ABQ4K8Y9_9BACI|nr:metallophosphoesterase [Siminovitchia fordii]GIN21456.1 phosphoesterase [Siminovitchia fordii]HBZ08830.1 metallophosphoesterase [Bacillus sp. (in: firmicutes)]
MKIVVTGDTHIRNKNKQLPECLLKECESADLIIHTGDWVSMEVHKILSEYAKVVGVHGNVDGDGVREHFNAKELFEVNGFKIGVVHGDGEKRTTEKRVLEAFEEEGTDIIIFGHSHIPMLRYVKKVMLMNPGSPTDKRKLPYYSYGILHIDEHFRAEIVMFD